MDETFRWNFDTIGLYYAKSKKQSEEEVLKAKEKGLNCVIVNPAFVFGAGDVNFNSGKLIKDLYYNKLPFYPLGGICVVDVEIVVETIIRAMEVGRIGERYIIGGDNLSYKELSDIISKVIGINMSIKPLPYPVATVLYKLLLLLDTKKYFNITLFRIASEFMYFSPEKAIRELGMRTEPIEYSIQRALDWYKKNKLL
jgi:dihydroflavonol-4-reductase